MAGNPCAGCGACCRYPRVSFYHGELDTQPGGTVPAELTMPLTPFLVCMKGTEAGKGRCIAYGDDGLCTIYEKRSSTCREFPAILPDGSHNPECERLRGLLGIERYRESPRVIGRMRDNGEVFARTEKVPSDLDVVLSHVRRRGASTEQDLR